MDNNIQQNEPQAFQPEFIYIDKAAELRGFGIEIPDEELSIYGRYDNTNDRLANIMAKIEKSRLDKIDELTRQN